MTKIRSSLVITGYNFSPAAYATMCSVPLSDPAEPGSIGKAGRFKGKPVPNGSATLEVSDKPTDWADFDRLLVSIRAAHSALIEAGAEDLELNCSIYHDGQCNFGFTNRELETLSALGVDLHISCYREHPPKKGAPDKNRKWRFSD